MWPAGRIIAAFVIVRALLLTIRLALLFDSPRHSDFLHFFLLAKQIDIGLLPYVHYWVEYPPIFPWLSMGVYLLSSVSATGKDSELLFYAAIGLMLVVAEAGVFLLIYRISHLLWELPTPLYSLMLYGLLFLPYYLWSGSFDTLPTLSLLAGLFLLLTGYTKASAAVAALGFCTKLFPVLLLPIAFCTITGWQKKLTYVLTFSLTAAAVFLPLTLVSPEMMWASLQGFWLRPPWETAWALAEGFYGWGVVRALSERTNPEAWASSGQYSTESWWIALIFAMLFLAFCWKFWNTRNEYKIVAGAGFTLCLLFLYSKGYSPQYLIWLAPFIVVLFPNRYGILYLAILGMANLIEAPLYFGLFPERPSLLFVAVVMRTACLCVLTLHCLHLSVGYGDLSRSLSISLRRLPG